MRVDHWQAWAEAREGPVLLDGGLATTLEADGCKLGDALWSARLLASNPAAVRSASAHFLEAGADIVSTCTYQASRDGFGAELETGSDEADSLMRGSIALARDVAEAFWRSLPAEDRAARGRKPLVALSLGPYGASLADGSEYHGRYDVPNGDVARFHETRLRAVLPGVAGSASSADSMDAPDVVALETIPNVMEAVILVRLMREVRQTDQCPFWISFQCRTDGALASDEHFGWAVAQLLAANAENQSLVAVGANCVRPEHVGNLVRLAREAIQSYMSSLQPGERWSLRVVAYPNSGETWAQGRGWQWPSKPSLPVSWAQRLIASGADILGGCCRCGPSHVKAIRTLAR
jgi:homocysteine S-methyltransferase